ncbi:MAG: Ig-like domain-containing protein [Terriglobales bacterium]
MPIADGDTVTFYRGATEIGRGTTSNGVAALTTSFSKARTYTLKAAYAGDASHKTSSGTVTQVVGP